MKKLCLAVAALLVMGITVAGPASADNGWVLSQKTSAVVSQLNLTRGTGTLVMDVLIGTGDQLQGVTVAVPAAASGTWHAVQAITPTARCASAQQNSLTLTCLPALGESVFPAGHFVISIPITFSGPTSGLWGTVAVIRPAQLSEFIRPTASPADHDPPPALPQTTVTDTFPIANTADTIRSTAEARWLDIVGGGDGLVGTGDLAITLSIVPGVHVYQVVVSLRQIPGLAWGLRNRQANGLTCWPVTDNLPVETAQFHCQHGAGSALPTGTSTIVLHLTEIGTATSIGYVELQPHAAGWNAQADTFEVRQHP